MEPSINKAITYFVSRTCEGYLAGHEDVPNRTAKREAHTACYACVRFTFSYQPESRSLACILCFLCTLTGGNTAGAGQQRLVISAPSSRADVAVAQNDLPPYMRPNRDVPMSAPHFAPWPMRARHSMGHCIPPGTFRIMLRGDSATTESRCECCAPQAVSLTGCGLHVRTS